MIACATHVVGELWFWVLVLPIVALPVAALAHVNGEHTQRRREQLSRRHPVNEPRVQIVEVLPKPAVFHDWPLDEWETTDG